MTNNNQLFHIIWTTYNEYPIWDRNGCWKKLTDTYSKLRHQNISCTLSHDLPDEYINKTPQNNRILLQKKSINQLRIEIHELCRENSDRVIDGLEIKALHINESKVEIVVLSNIKVLHQKISRLKSKTSSVLLSSKYTEEFSGNKIWGKGFWYSIILNKEDLAIAMIKNGFSEEF
ncbi:hypothetical protein [uncultured Chryseobacterium sp.]|uniref:hypothetical protein n=1 Tax=uncultured Chryseobacterium sp. TaxID=259322 RepID=UPI003747D778